MNSTRKVAWVIVVLVIATIAWLLLSEKQPATSMEITGTVTNSEAVQQVAAPMPQPFQQPPVANSKTESASTNATVPHISAKDNRMGQAALERNFPIQFYGKVVDDVGAPLGEVTVAAEFRNYFVGTDGKPTSFSPKTNIMTQSDGTFSVHGLVGDVFAVDELSKDGYEQEPGDVRTFSYDPSQNFTPDPGNPVIFRLWSKDNKQPLVFGEKFVKIMPDGRSYSVDLMTGNINGGGGDLQIWAKRPDTLPEGQQYFEWSFGIRVPNGGVLVSQDPAGSMFLAPAEGYTNEYVYTHPDSHSGWGSSSGDRHFYVVIRGNVYGRIDVTVNTYFDGNISGFNVGDGTLSLRYTINPSGSRVLR